MSQDLELYDYQKQLIESLREGFKAGHRSQMLYGATGCGKTEIAISLLDATARNYHRAAMVLDRVILCNQTSERLDKYGIDHGVLQSGHWRYRPYERIQVCSAQTLEKRGTLPDIDLLVVDEAHQTRKQTIQFIKNNPKVRVVGLSATPFTKGLGQVYTNVVSAITTHELVNIRQLVPLRVYVGKEIDMAGVKKVAGEWSEKEAGVRGIKITGDVVSEWVKKTTEVFGGPRKTIVFAAGVAHAADLAQKFAEAGYNFVSLSYKDDDDFKKQAIDDFARPDTSIHGLIATDILTKGFDVKDVMVGVSARPFSKSLASHIQQMGRVMRCSPGKEFAIWLCLARGSRVLTNRGLVPIEQVSISDKIWDGTNFVAHGGAVCNGIQKTITYQGLTATPGHIVHTAQGWRTFGDCAREQISITQTGLGGKALRLREDHQPGRVVARSEVAPVHSRGLRVLDLWLSVRDFAVELGTRTYKRVQGMQPAHTGISALAICESAGNARSMSQSERRKLFSLWCPWSGISFRGGESRNTLDYGESRHPASSGNDAARPHRSRRTLRAWKRALADRGAESVEQTRESSGCANAQIPSGASGNSLFGQHTQATTLERNDGNTDHREIPSAVIETEREVWDILDAGPNNRFTCEGLLVHNCHSGNYLGFQDQWEDVYFNGVQRIDEGREKPRKERSPAERERATCPRCGTVWVGNTDTCACCGFVRVKFNEVLTVPGELQAIDGGKNVADKQIKQEWYSQLLHVARLRGYSDGWAAHKYKERFTVWPRGLHQAEAEVSPEVASWVKSRQIAWAKSKRRAA